MAKEKKEIEVDFKAEEVKNDTPIEAAEEEVIENESNAKEVWEKSKPILKKIRNGLLCAAAGALGAIGVGYLIGKKEVASDDQDEEALGNYLIELPSEEEKE